MSQYREGWHSNAPLTQGYHVLLCILMYLEEWRQKTQICGTVRQEIGCVSLSISANVNVTLSSLFLSIKQLFLQEEHYTLNKYFKHEYQQHLINHPIEYFFLDNVF